MNYQTKRNEYDRKAIEKINKAIIKSGISKYKIAKELEMTPQTLQNKLTSDTAILEFYFVKLIEKILNKYLTSIK